MKIFKRIYYPVIAALAVLMLVLGLVDARVGNSGGNASAAQVNDAYDYAVRFSESSHNSFNPDAQENARDYIVRTLTEAGAKEVIGGDLDDDGNNTADYFERSEEGKYPSVYVQKAKLRRDSQKGNDIAAEYTVENIILAIPGTGSDAVLLHARYDSSYLGGASDSAATGAMLKSAVDMLKSGKSPNNTVVYLFGDAGQEGDLGACAFINQFAGFDGVADSVRAVADFRTAGTGGALMMYGNENGALDIISKYSSYNGGAYTSSALPVLMGNGFYAGTKVFGDYASLTFTNLGGANKYGTADDVKVNKSLVEQNLNAMNKFTECFANASVSDMKADGNAIYFSYLDVFTVNYSNVGAYVIAAVIAALAIATVIVNMRTKAFSWGKTLAGAAVQVVSLLGSMLAMLAMYYLFALLLSGFGVLPFQGLSSIKFAGTGLFVSATIMAITVAIAFYIILKRTFAVKAGDVVRGNVLLFALAAFIVSFACPAISYPLTCVALFSLAAMLATAIFKAKFKAKFAMDIDRLFLYAWAAVFALPLVLPLVFVAQTVFPLLSIVIVMAVMIALAGFITPYADYLKPCLDKLFKKLPMRTVRYERMVTEKVEDRAKKGKFTEVTSKKIIKEKVAWNYLNRIGLVTVAIIASVMIMLFSSFSTSFSSSALDAPEYYNNIYDDSLVYVYDGSSVTAEVHDLIAYDYFREAINDMAWNDDKNAYVKSFNGKQSDIIPTTPSISDKNGNNVKFTTFDLQRSQITIRLEDAASVTKVSFDSSSNANKLEYEFRNNENIVLRLPYGYELDGMNIEGNCRIVYEQHIYNQANLQTVDWQKLIGYAAGNPKDNITPRSGIVIKLSKSV